MRTRPSANFGGPRGRTAALENPPKSLQIVFDRPRGRLPSPRQGARADQRRAHKRRILNIAESGLLPPAQGQRRRFVSPLVQLLSHWVNLQLGDSSLFRPCSRHSFRPGRNQRTRWRYFEIRCRPRDNPRVRAIHFASVRAWLDTRNQHIVRRPLIYSPVSKKPPMKVLGLVSLCQFLTPVRSGRVRFYFRSFATILISVIPLGGINRDT